MTSTEARLRHASLCAEIRKQDHQYHVLRQPLISDADYDALVRELLTLEAEFPELITPDSPSQRPGRVVLRPLNKPMCAEPAFRMPDLMDDARTLTHHELEARLDLLKMIKKKDFRQLLEDEAFGGQCTRASFTSSRTPRCRAC